MKAVCLWSGGKDSAYACYSAQAAGHQIMALITFLDEEGRLSRSHGLSARVILRQAEGTGIPLRSRAMSQSHFEEDFKDWMAQVKKETGLEAVVFGDIHLREHKEWIDRVCRELAVVPLLPLWGKEPGLLAEEMVASGFKAIVVATRSDVLGDEWLGKTYNRSLWEALPPGIDPLGENGEFHTLVYDGPIFKRPIPVQLGEKRQRDGQWWLDILVEGDLAGDQP